MSVKSKVMSMPAAIAAHVKDGDSLYLLWGSPASPAAAVNEIIRQGKKDITIYSIAVSGRVAPLFYGNQVKRIITG